MRCSVSIGGLVALLASACLRPSSGAPVQHLPGPGAVESRATTAEPDGIRVLLDGRVDGSEDGTWMASSTRELTGLWRRVGGRGEAPAVDFGTHVVLGTGFMDGPCQGEIVAAEVDEHGTLTMATEPLAEACIALAVRVGRAVAVPRRILPETFVWVPRHRESEGNRRFTLPPPSGPPRHTTIAGSEPLEREALAETFGTVALPAQGVLALRSLDDGRQVWVARHANGDIAVVLADRPPGRGGPRLSRRVSWEPQRGRFATGHDSFGRSVVGGAPLPTLTFRRQGERIAIGPPAALPPGPVVRRDRAPRLDGPARPYEDLPETPVHAIPEGRLVRVQADLVFGVSGPPRLCTPPEDPKLQRHWLGCDEGHLAYTGARAEDRSGISSMHGPLVVRRRGDTLDLVITLGAGYSGGVRDHRIQPPAPRGDTRDRGRLAVGDMVRGDTRGAADGFEPPCVAAGGAPDERWTLRSETAQRVALEIESDYDGALAVTGPGGGVLACNDDRHGHYRSSIVHVDLEPGVPVQVVVDGFGGAAGTYRLRARAEAPLPNDGVLPIGGSVAGDTRGATDDQSSMCTALGPDHEYRFEVAQTGLYRFVIEAADWSPLIAIRPDGADQVRACRVGRSRVEDEHRLEPGTYWIIVDGVEAESAGRYELRAERITAPRP